MALTTPDVTVDMVARRLRGERVDRAGLLFRLAMFASLFFVVAMLVILMADVLVGGLPKLGERGVSHFVQLPYSSNADITGVFQGLVGTVSIAVIVAVIAFPLGVAAAVYLEEYAPKSRFTDFIELNIRNLAGVPSVVYGILGFSVFVKALGGVTGGRSVLAGGLTLAVLALPIVIITSAEAIRAVPDSIREGAFGVGATRWEVIRTNVLSYAMPGILTGTVLSLARAMGEAAPLILVGARTGFFTGGEWGDLTGNFTALPNLIADWASLPQDRWAGNVSAAIVVLLALVLAANAGAILLRNHYEKKR